MYQRPTHAKMPKEADVQRAMDKRDYKVKMQSAFITYILQPWIWILISAILLSVLIATQSFQVTGTVAGIIGLGLVGFYVVWYIVTYLFLFVLLSLYKMILSIVVPPKEKR